MFKKKQSMVEKKYSSFKTNDGYIVSEYFSNPIKRVSDFNKMKRRK